MSFWPREGGIRSAQDIEDLATAAWLSETLFAALELGVFASLGEDAVPIGELALRCGSDAAGFARLVDALAALGLLTLHGEAPAVDPAAGVAAGAASGDAGPHSPPAVAPGGAPPGAPQDGGAAHDAGPRTGSAEDGRLVACSAIARMHLVPGAPGYLGDSLSYRRLLAGRWGMLADAVRRGGSPLSNPADEDVSAYLARVRDYVRAMDDVARHKARLICDRLDLSLLRPARVVDLGGGAGALSAEVLRRGPDWEALVLDVPEVVAAAAELWAARGGDPEAPDADPRTPAEGAALRERLGFAACNLLDEEVPAAEAGGGWGLVVASNVVHAYSAPESGAVLDRAVRALSEDGLLVVHDFFTAGPGRGPVKSSLFDLHMMINTYQGRTYPWSWVRGRLEAHGLVVEGPVPVGGSLDEEDTALMVAARRPGALAALRADRLALLDGVARDLGFRRCASLYPGDVVTAPWVEVKCRFGCGRHGAGGCCPPRSPGAPETRELLASYSRALLVEGEPPTADFHRRMLRLERAAFLGGAPKALAFTAGPCLLCAECEPDACRRPAEARPSLEASGVDVYATAAAAGWRLEPVPDRESPAVYVGLLLVE